VALRLRRRLTPVAVLFQRFFGGASAVPSLPSASRPRAGGGTGPAVRTPGARLQRAYVVWEEVTE
jgi:hypothetical protein